MAIRLWSYAAAILTFGLAVAGACQHASAATVVYTYDGLQRIKGVDYDNQQATITYTYDAAGNRTHQGVTVADRQDPVLTITSPANTSPPNGTVTTGSEFTFSGTATDRNTGDSGIASITINGQPVVGGATNNGTQTIGWSLTLPLEIGDNTFTVVATDHSYGGNQAAQILSVGTDSDNDGLPDAWEMQNFNDLTTADATTDSDGDGLPDIQEYAHHTDPNNPDTDGDGYSDYDEVTYGSNPLLATDTLDSHRPFTPTLHVPNGDIPLHGAQFTADAFSDPDLTPTPSDYLAAAQWEISSAAGFADDALIFNRTITRNNTTDAADLGLTLTVEYGILNKGTQYWIRTRHRDSVGLWSAWSNAKTFTTAVSDTNDADGNGIDDRYQVNGFTDTNGNGVDDSQEDITPISNADDGGTVGIGVSSGVITDITAVPSSTIPLPILPDLPLQFGLFSFRVQGLPVDAANPSSVQVTFILPQSTTATLAKWYKYDQVTNKVTDISGALTVSGNTATVTITDGSTEDADGVINGVIVDPGGPAYQAVSASVKTGSSPITPGSEVINTGVTSGGGSGLWLLMAGLVAAASRLKPRRAVTGREIARSDG